MVGGGDLFPLFLEGSSRVFIPGMEFYRSGTELKYFPFVRGNGAVSVLNVH